MRHKSVVIAIGLAIPTWCGLAQEEKKPRNPFGVADISDPDGKDVQEFAGKAKARLSLDDRDPNAASWSKEVTKGTRGSLDGDWDQRWTGGGARVGVIAGKAKIVSVGDRVYVLCKDRTGDSLLELKREGSNLTGRYAMVRFPTDSTPWFGVIINGERIDGAWTGGRWDLRRKTDLD